MKKLSIHAFILFVILFLPIFVNAESRNVTVHGTIHEGYYERMILDSVNEQRRKAGVPELQMDMALTRAARQRAIEIGTYYDSRHLRTNLGSASSVMDDFGIGYSAFGENIAAGYSDVSTVMNAWITSTPHYNNIVNTRYSAIGIGVYQSIDGRWFWVQNFKDSLNTVYSPNVDNQVVGDYAVRYEDTIRSSYSADSLSSVTLEVGESYPINFHVTTYNEVTNSTIPLYLLDWESSNSEVCAIETINQNVSVVAKGAGSCSIHTTFGGVNYSFEVKVNGSTQPIETSKMIQVTTNYNSSPTLLEVDSTEDLSTLRFSVDEISRNSITLYYDEKVLNPSALNILFCEDDDCTSPVRYQSDDNTIADYIHGEFIFQNSGQTTITAIFENGIQVRIPIEVYDYRFEKDLYNLFTGTTQETKILSNQDLNQTFQSLDESIVEVDQDGTLTSKKSGETFVQAFREDAVVTAVKVMVYDPEEFRINVDRENVELYEEENTSITIGTNLENANITYELENPSIAQWKNGTIYGKQAGSTTLIIHATHTVADGLILSDEKEISITVIKKKISVTDILLSKMEYELKVGDEVLISADVSPENADDKTLVWKSSDDHVVTVDGNGKTLALSAGEAVITVTANNGISKEISVKVLEDVLKPLQVDKTHVELYVGEKETIHARYSYSNLEWTSENELIAMVDSNGTITALKPGSTIIHVTNGEEDIPISVLIQEDTSITKIEIAKDEMKLTENEETTIEVTLYPSQANKLDLVWMSTNTDVASVDQNGKVKALSTGEADITITSVNGVRSVVHIIVVPKSIPISNLDVLKDTVSLMEDETYSISVIISPSNATDLSLHYQSSDPTVATVDSNGVVKAIADGQAIITISSSSGVSTQVTIQVRKKVIPITDIEVRRTSIHLFVDETYVLTAKVIPDNTTDESTLSWTSSNENVVKVNQSGRVTAVNVGRATIFVKTLGGLQKEIAVMVSKKVVPNEFDVDFQTNPFPIENENGKAVLLLTEKDTSTSVQISDNERLIALYDITFQEGSNSTFEKPTYRVSIPFHASSDDYASIYVASILNGEIQNVFLSDIHDGKIHFTTDHFSEYAVIGVLKNKGEIAPVPSSPSSTSDTVVSNNPKTGSPIVIYIVLWIVAFLVLTWMTNLLFRDKKEND